MSRRVSPPPLYISANHTRSNFSKMILTVILDGKSYLTKMFRKCPLEVASATSRWLASHPRHIPIGSGWLAATPTRLGWRRATLVEAGATSGGWLAGRPLPQRGRLPPLPRIFYFCFFFIENLFFFFFFFFLSPQG